MKKTMVTMKVKVPVHFQATEYGVEDRYIDPAEAIIAVEPHLEKHSEEIDGILLDDYNERAAAERDEIIANSIEHWMTPWRDAI